MEELKKTEMKKGDNELHKERGNSHTMSEVDLMITELHIGDAMNNTGKDGSWVCGWNSWQKDTHLLRCLTPETPEKRMPG